MRQKSANGGDDAQAVSDVDDDEDDSIDNSKSSNENCKDRSLKQNGDTVSQNNTSSSSSLSKSAIVPVKHANDTFYSSCGNLAANQMKQQPFDMHKYNMNHPSYPSNRLNEPNMFFSNEIRHVQQNFHDTNNCTTNAYIPQTTSQQQKPSPVATVNFPTSLIANLQVNLTHASYNYPQHDSNNNSIQTNSYKYSANTGPNDYGGVKYNYGEGFQSYSAFNQMNRPFESDHYGRLYDPSGAGMPIINQNHLSNYSYDSNGYANGNAF